MESFAWVISPARSSRLLSFPCAGLDSRVFPVVLISMLADKLNMSPEEAERWIVNLIRNARLDAKIDSKLVRPSDLFIRRLHACDLSIGKIPAALCKVKVVLRGFKPPFVSQCCHRKYCNWILQPRFGVPTRASTFNKHACHKRHSVISRMT